MAGLSREEIQQITRAAVRRGRTKRLLRQRLVQDMVMLTLTEPQLKSLSVFRCQCPSFGYTHTRGLSSRCIGCES